MTTVLPSPGLFAQSVSTTPGHFGPTVLPTPGRFALSPYLFSNPLYVTGDLEMSPPLCPSCGATSTGCESLLVLAGRRCCPHCTHDKETP